MKAVQQYIDLLQENRTLIDNHSAPVLNALRDTAIADLQTIGLPDTSREEFLHTDVSAFFAPDYGLNLARVKRVNDPKEVFRCHVPNLGSNLFLFVGDNCHAMCKQSEFPQGVIACSLHEAALSHPHLVARYYGTLAHSDNDGTVALNTALAQDGFFLFVPRGVIVEKPIQLVNIMHGQHDFMACRRLLVVIEEGAQAKILSCDHTIDKGNFLSSQVNEIFVGKNATFDYYDLEESTLNTRRVASTFVRQDEGSNLLINGITLHNGYTRNNYYITLDGPHAESRLYGMAVADKRQVVDNYSFIDHKAPECTSNELFKYVLDEMATGVFNGRILVREGVQKTSAIQTNRNLCSTKEAHIYTQPQLEIYADDVKCSHGATVGQLDNNALFYMRSRGIPEAEARMLLMVAFTHDVIDMVRIDSLKESLHKLVERRFRGTLDKCAGCRICQ
ncbi:MAG: Fe-S cluster assembly protein SufD [Coprobacter sp.]|nr:Fe-S cluster assembly protein SufD [Coprobacter sp.]